MYCLDFDKCVHSCNYPHIKMQNIFITSKAPLCFFYSQSLQPAWPQPTLICFEFKDQFIFSKFPINGTIKYQNVLFCTWLLSFSKMYLKFIRCCCVQLQLVPLYLFIFCQVLVHFMHGYSTTCTSISRLMDCLQFLTIVNNAAVKICIQVILWTYVYLSWENITSGKFKFTFIKNCKVFSKAVVPFCIFINHA